MRASELLRSEVANLPKPPRNGDFRDALQSVFDAYLAQIDLLDGDDYASHAVHDARPRIADVGLRLLAVLDASLRGQPARARRVFEEAVAGIHSELEAFRSIEMEQAGIGILYRIRVNPPGAHLHPRDLFHIPFHLRHLVAPQRFSVIGVPMLYLGSSPFVCWEELRRPPLDQVWVSAFRLRDAAKARVLNLAYRPGYLGQLLDAAGNPSTATGIANLCVAGAVIWPLVAACSFQVGEDGPFKVEYVIPQILMSWLAESEEYLGVRYFSTHVQTPAALPASINYVFPAQEIATSGHCAKLASMFEMTEPVSWTYAEAIGAQTSYLAPLRTKAVLELGKGHAVPYEGTRFSHMEFLLDQLQFGAAC